ncbi:MAG TPA: sugar phosphate isomerase/epimerase [Nitrososphaeraceae archaeon]|jgi:sugar phosphate isomerase/epimerase|nr:sugar phosphate isomerase/epimerase [Nitrososphaeraceae archaeon]
MKLAFSTNAFKRYSLEEAIRMIAEIGYEGIELLCDSPHAYPPTFQEKEIKSFKDQIAKFKLRISNLNAFTLYSITDVYHPSWIEDDKELRELRIIHTINCIKLAKKIGAKNLSTEPGGPINKRITNVKYLEKLFMEGLDRISPIAEEENVKILIEPEPGLLLENSNQFLDFIKNLNTNHIRLNFDIGHFFCVGEDPAEIIYKLCDYIEHFHLADIASNRIHNHLIPGEGSINFRAVLKTIETIGFKGFVTVELYPYQDNPKEAAKRAYEYLNEILY